MVERRLRRTPTKRDIILFLAIIATAAAVLYLNRDTPRFPAHPQFATPVRAHVAARAPAAATRAKAAKPTWCPAHARDFGKPVDVNTLDTVDDGSPGVTIDPTGCTIALQREDQLLMSWDGGQQFKIYDRIGHLDHLVLTTERVVMRLGNRLGVLRPGAAAIAWRDLGPLALPPEADEADDADSADAPGHLPYLTMATAGRWIAVLRVAGTGAAAKRVDNTALPFGSAASPGKAGFVDAKLGLTDDDGVTWRYLAPPTAEKLAITDDGALRLTHDVWRDGKRVLHRVYASDRSYARWPIVADLAPPPWRYEFATGPHGGCGGAIKLLAYRDGRLAGAVVDGLEPMAGPTDIATNGGVTYALFDHKLYRLQGTQKTLLGDATLSHLVAVDRDGGLFARVGTNVVRWTERGGWRQLWPPGPDAN